MENIQPPTANAQHPMAGEESLGGTPKTTGETPVLPRLPVQVVEHLHRLLGGDARVEAMVLRFIADKYGAKDLTELAAPVASQIIKRPADFLKAVKQHCEPELKF